jgi:aminoglycoside phosphotransferase (APT) family kinase protein
LLRHAMPHATSVAVSNLAPLFGGNARKAWSFDAQWMNRDDRFDCLCVMLSQVGGRQVESDIHREFMVLHGLNGKGVRVPTAIAVDRDGEIVGSPSIVLQRLPGKANAVEFLKSRVPADSRAITEDLALVVAQLHAVDWNAAEFDPSLATDSPQQIVARQIAHWEATFVANRLEPNPVMSALFGWLGRNVPVPQRICLVHGDLRPGNFLYEGQRVAGLLDWEMAHLGDPVEDLGWIYRPLWSPERFVPLDEFVALYAKHAGREIAWRSVMYYRIFSELKFAAISLTAANAFASGKTLNLRHADRAATVAPCLKRCLEWVEQSERGLRHV